jgi:hypothetical protein
MVFPNPSSRMDSARSNNSSASRAGLGSTQRGELCRLRHIGVMRAMYALADGQRACVVRFSFPGRP